MLTPPGFRDDRRAGTLADLVDLLLGRPHAPVELMRPILGGAVLRARNRQGDHEYDQDHGDDDRADHGHHLARTLRMASAISTAPVHAWSRYISAPDGDIRSAWSQIRLVSRVS